MQMRRRFQPMVEGLAYRIAPSTIVGTTAAIATTMGAGDAVMGALDTSPSQTAVASPISLAPALSGAASDAIGSSADPGIPEMDAYDADPPQTGVASPIILAPPPSSGDGTGIC